MRVIGDVALSSSAVSCALFEPELAEVTATGGSKAGSQNEDVELAAVALVLLDVVGSAAVVVAASAAVL